MATLAPKSLWVTVSGWFGIAATAAVAAWAGPAAMTPKASYPLTGLALPARAAAVGLQEPGVLTGIDVRPGDTVVAGMPLFQLADEVEALAAERAAAEAASTHKLAMAKATLEKAEADQARVDALQARHIESDTRMLEARIATRLAELAVEQARHEQAMARTAHEEAVARLGRRRSIAPFDGVVDFVHKEVGEAVDQLEPVVELVQLDPLLIELHCPAAAADAYPTGTAVPVARTAHPEDVRTALVVFRSPQVDAASQTVRIRMELPNGERADGRSPWAAGLKIDVHPPATPTPGPGKGR